MKTFLKAAALGAAGLALSASLALAGPYDSYKGTTLVVNFPAHPHFNAVRKILGEFTKETGIKVEVDQLQYLKMREKQTLELTKPLQALPEEQRAAVARALPGGGKPREDWL